MSNSFYVCLLSNVPDYPDNQPNKFRVHLPKPLYFSGDWVCGVHSISYPYSWSSTIGTLDEQWIKIHFIDENSKKNVIRIPVPAASHINVEALENYLATTLKHQADSIGSLDKTGGFIQPPSVLGSPPRAEKRKRSAEEELRSPSPYSEDDNENSPPTPDEELRDPSPIEDPPPPIEEPRSPSPYSEDESPSPKKDKEEDQTQIDSSTSTQKAVLDNEEKNRQENITQTNTRNEDKELAKPKNIEPKSPPKLNQTQITTPVLTQKENTQKPSPPKNIEPKSPPKLNQTQITPPVLTLKENTQKSSPPKKNMPPPKKDKKEENQTQTTSPAVLNKETNIEPPSPPRIDQNETQTTPPVIANEKNTQQPTVLSTIGLEKPREEKKEQNKTQPPSVLAAMGLNSTKKEEKKNTSLLSVIGLDRKDNMTQTSPPPSPTVFEAMGLKSDKNSSRGDKLFQVLFGKESKKAPNPSFVKSIIESLVLDYHNDFARFKLLYSHKSIKHVSFSPQLGYVLGFANPQHVQNNEIAKYGCDLRGGFSSFAIYAKGLTENMIVGNSLSSLLRIVSVTGAVPGEYHEKIYDSPIYVRVLPREVNEIEVELRTMDNGRLVPFAYGTVSIVLIFKKVINF